MLFTNQHCAFGQYQVFSTPPLKGNIDTTEIYELIGDSTKYHLLDRRIYNTSGKIVREEYYPEYYNRYEKPRFKVHQYLADKEIRYSCKCNDIDDFVNSFNIKSNENLNRSAAGGTPNAPTADVTIKTLTKSGKLGSLIVYSRTGYTRSETRFEYDKQDSLVSRKRYNSDGSVSRQFYYSYLNDSVYEIADTDFFGNDSIYQVYRYTHGELTYSARYNNDQLVYMQRYEPDTGSLSIDDAERQFDSSENLTHLTYFLDDGTFNVKYFFTYDEQNNWVTLRELRKVTHYDLENKKTIQIRERNYVRKVGYRE